MNWVKIYYAQNEIDAKIIQGLLESNKVEIQVIAKSADNIIQSPYFYTQANVPYELFVHEKDLEKAKKFSALKRNPIKNKHSRQMKNR